MFRREPINLTLNIPAPLAAPFIAILLLYRRLRFGYPFRRIPLTQGKHAIVDPDDYHRLKKHKWFAAKGGNTFYANRTCSTKSGKAQHIAMHRYIIKVPHDMFVDHINHNGLDNRKPNLRPATCAQNSRNRGTRSNRPYGSKYKGVTWRPERNLYQAQIGFGGKQIFLGSFNDERRAAKVYDYAAKEYHGRFACLNFPPPKRSLSSRIFSLLSVPLTCLICFSRSAANHQLTNSPLTAAPAANKVAPMPKTLYIIDGHAHIYAAYFAPMRQQLTSPSGEPTKATYIFTAAILGLIQRKNPDMLAVAMDSKAPTFRKKIYPEYKAHRPPMPDDMPPQINRIDQILGAMNVPVFRIDGYEADDIIGTLAKKAAADGHDVMICSKDKDILQLLSDRVSTLDIKKDEATTVASLHEKLGITPDQFIDVLALQGDTSDNVPGIPDVGPKTALDWIRKYGSIENLYEHADEIKGKRGDNLRKFKDTLDLGKTLVTIDSNVPVSIDYEALAVKEFDKTKLAEIFSELGFTRLLTQLSLSGAPASAAAEPPGEPATPKTTKHDYRLIDTQEKLEAFLGELKKQKIFAVDTETTSIFPCRADLVGISFSWQPYTGFYLPVKAPLGQKCLDLTNLRKQLAPILADKKIKKIGQNIKYDLIVFQNAQMPLKGIYFDTMIASYCLDPERRRHSLDKMALDFLNYECIPISAVIGKGKNQLTFDMVDTAAAVEYAAEDADVTWQLYCYLKDPLEKQTPLEKLFYDVEMPLVPVLAVMERNGVSLDTSLLRNMSAHLDKELKTITDQIYELTGAVFNIDSPKQLAEILFDRLQLKSLRIGKAGRSTDAAVLEQLSDQHPVADFVLQYRTLNKLRTTYVDKLGSLISLRTNRLHCSFNQTVTATGRLSSSDPNLQNIPIRTEIGSKVRAAFIPEKETDCILSADYSQIELRLLAHFSRDKALLAAFAADQDIHSFVASQIFNVGIEEVTSEMRSRCKAVNFGIIYGQGAFGLSRSIGISQAEARKFIDDYFARYSSIREFMDSVIASVKETGYAETILHRRRKISNLSSPNANKRAQAERLAVNTVIQGSAADLIKVAMINIQKKIETENLPVKMILQVHDELVFELPTTEAEQHARWIAEKMTTAIKLDVPLKVDIAHGPTWLAKK